MAQSKHPYLINVHYPESEADLFELRRKLGAAYTEFVKDYILSLHFSDEEKNKLYKRTMERLKG